MEQKQDNYGAFLSVNAKFALEYNFGIRYGNEDQNAVRLGIAKDQFFFNVGTSYRRPNLYELYGDAYVDPNADLLPEEGVGYEIGFGAISIFKYEFEEAIEYVRSLKLTTQIEWQNWAKSDQRPTDIPSHPNTTYAKDFEKLGIKFSFPFWLGSKNVSNNNRNWLPFNEAREFARSLNLKGSTDWRNWLKTGARPNNIPSDPEGVYKDQGWINWSNCECDCCVCY